MDLKEAFKNRIYKLKEEAYNRDILLPFYNLENQELIKSCFKKNDVVKPYFYGGYDNSEYKKVILSSNDYDLDFSITTLKINCYEDNILSHRSILGSILGLGLKREVVGDIIKYNNDYYFFVDSKMAKFIIDNLNKIGQAFITLEIVKDKIDYQITYLEETKFISSLRLDNLVSTSYNLARNKAKDMIVAGLVQVNHTIVLKEDKQVKVNDIISVRGKGRFILSEIAGKTKSDNLVIKIKKPQ